MKGLKAPDYIREIRVLKEGNDIYLKYYSEPMGYQNIGLRLSKTGKLPDIPRRADNMEDAVLLLEEWNKWLKTESIHSSGNQKKPLLSQKSKGRSSIGELSFIFTN
jgi:hypothetical protein